jgi:Zn-dependent protease
MEASGFTRRVVNELPDLISLMTFFGVTALLFRSLQFALLVTASLGFHELGHALMLSRYGVEWRISFGVVGALTWSPLPARERLSHLANALIHLSGPSFSLLLALLAMSLQVIWKPGDQHLLTLANFSAQVGFLNLLPIGPLTDGGKIIQRMILPLDRTRRAWIIMLPLLATVLMLTIDGLVHLQDGKSIPFFLSLLLVGLWMASSMLIESRWNSRSQPVLIDSGRPMTAGQVYFLVLVMWDLLVLSLIITAATPFWLTPEYLLGSLRNVVALLQWIGQMVL